MNEKLTTFHAVTVWTGEEQLIEGKPPLAFHLHDGIVDIGETGYSMSLQAFIDAAIQLKRLDAATQPLPKAVDMLSVIFGKAMP